MFETQPDFHSSSAKKNVNKAMYAPIVTNTISLSKLRYHLIQKHNRAIIRHSEGPLKIENPM